MFDSLSESDREKLKKVRQPREPDPMLATLTDDRFSHPDWIFERKLDGERALLIVKGSDAKMITRNQKDISGTYPEIVDAAADQVRVDLVADGEVVAFEGDTTSFSRLQNRMQLSGEEALESGIAVYYYVFDLLWADGFSTEQLPLRTRKSLLKSAIDYEGRIRFTAHKNEDGKSFYRDACEKGWEGVIAKKASSTYVHGRSRKWLKFKCTARQELVIGGFTPPEGERIGFGALLLGYYEDDSLRYAGKVGTGFDDETLERLSGRLEELERKTSPFDDETDEADAQWVRPELVAEIGFTEWTEAGKLRHPRFLGLRRDKDASDVHREKPS